MKQKHEERIQVLNILPGLRQGGAEVVISNIIRHSDPTKIQHHILLLEKEHSFDGEFDGLPVTIHHLSKMNLKEKIALAKQIDVAHTGHRKATLLTTALAKTMDTKIILGIHCTRSNNLLEQGLETALYAKLVEPAALRSADHIVCCTDKVRDQVLSRGWDGHKVQVITNGINPEHFTRSKEAAIALKKEVNIPADAVVVGISARYAPMKDIPNFIKAARLVKETYPDKPLCFLFCGRRMNAANKELVAQLKEAGIYAQARLLGVRTDMKNVYSATDIQVLSSSKFEALSMALLESSAAGCLCVSTDVGDHKSLMDKTGGICVPIKNPAALAEGIGACLELTQDQRKQKSAHARAAIVEHYHVKNMANRYNDLFTEVGLERRQLRQGLPKAEKALPTH